MVKCLYPDCEGRRNTSVNISTRKIIKKKITSVLGISRTRKVVKEISLMSKKFH